MANKKKAPAENPEEPQAENPGAPEEAAAAPSDIKVGDPINLKRDLPLVVELPKGASSAQREYAKILNAYAYANPDKWPKKKKELIAKLNSLADKEVLPLGEEGSRLELNRAGERGSTPYAFNFLTTKEGPVSTLPASEEKA